MPLKIAIIGRVGFHKEMEKYGASRISQQSMQTPFGKSSPIHSMIFRKIPFYVISRHGEKGYDLAAPYVNDRANLFALKKKGVGKIISISAPGSLSAKIKPGSLLIPNDVIDWSNNPDRSFFKGRGIGIIRMNEPFCPSIRALVSMELESNFTGALHREGVYVCTAGPRLETRAEIRGYAHHGGSVVGMTLAPEVFLARELEICYAAICYPVNYAEGIAERPYQAGVLFEGLATEKELGAVEKIEEAAPQIILNMIPKMEVLAQDCDCPNALLRYKKRGDLSKDFNGWFK